MTEAQRETIRWPLSSVDRTDFAGAATARMAAEATCDAAWVEGRAGSMEQAIACTLQDAPT